MEPSVGGGPGDKLDLFDSESSASTVGHVEAEFRQPYIVAYIRNPPIA